MTDNDIELYEKIVALNAQYKQNQEQEELTLVIADDLLKDMFEVGFKLSKHSIVKTRLVGGALHLQLTKDK